MKRANVTFLAIGLSLIIVNRLPAPIQEVPESPTPAPEQSAKPKAKRTIKTESKVENSESSTKRQTPPPPPKSQATAQRILFDGTWNGSFQVDDSRTLIIGAAGTVVTEKSVRWGTATWPATCDGASMRWKTAGDCSWTLIPNADGKTMLGTATCPGFLGIGAGTWLATFHKTSP